LMADFVTVNGTQLQLSSVKAKQVASKYDDQYGFNACRIPWRVAYDYQLNHSQVSKSVVKKMCQFFTNEKKITAVYTLNGKAVESYSNVAFTAPVAYAATVISDQTLSSRYRKVLTEPMVAKDYYPATIQMVTLLTCGSIGKNQK